MARPGANLPSPVASLPTIPSPILGRQFDAVLLDPPRAGLDDFTRSQLYRYRLVMLVSCNPELTLARDIGPLQATHDLVELAVIDHFPGTRYIECAVCLVKRD